MIKKATIDDLDKIVALEKKLFLSPWNKENYLYELTKNQFSSTYIIYNDDVLVGYINYWILFDQAEINKVGVDVKYQNQGFGSKLMELALKNIDLENCFQTHLEVRVSNNKAINLYKKFSFKDVRIKKGYYDDGEDALEMVRSIGDVYEG